VGTGLFQIGRRVRRIRTPGFTRRCGNVRGGKTGKLKGPWIFSLESFRKGSGLRLGLRFLSGFFDCGLFECGFFDADGLPEDGDAV
jgi:hypothetical protein